MSKAIKVSTIGERIELRLATLGMSQADLRRKSGVSQGLLTHLRNGRVKLVDCVRIFALADALDCEARWLATGEGNAEKK